MSCGLHQRVASYSAFVVVAMLALAVFYGADQIIRVVASARILTIDYTSAGLAGISISDFPQSAGVF